jgi:hypothetical protein
MTVEPQYLTFAFSNQAIASLVGSESEMEDKKYVLPCEVDKY